MDDVQLRDLRVFLAVARESSFSQAARELGVGVTRVSQSVRDLEEHLGLRLFNRTTRSVALTDAGERLLEQSRTILSGVERLVESANGLRINPSGTLRLLGSRPFGAIMLRHLIGPFMAAHPTIGVEITMDDALGDIVSGRYDAGIRVGHRIESDMIIRRIGGPFRMLTVASPAYLAERGRPHEPKDLLGHNCIVYRPSWNPTVHWRYGRGEDHQEIVPQGTLVLRVSDADLWLNAAQSGVGVAYLPEPVVRPSLADGSLISLMEDWTSVIDGVFLYHPSRRRPPVALDLFLRFLTTNREA